MAGGGGRRGAARSQRQKPPPGIWVSGLSRARSSSRPSSPSRADGEEEQTFSLWDQGGPRTYCGKLRGHGDCLLDPSSPARRTSRSARPTIRSVCPRGHPHLLSAPREPALCTAEPLSPPTLPAPCFPGTFLLVSPGRPRASAPSPAVSGLWGTHPFSPPHRGAASAAQLLLSWAPHGDRWPREGPHPRSLMGRPSAISELTSTWASTRGQGHGSTAGTGRYRRPEEDVLACNVPQDHALLTTQAVRNHTSGQASFRRALRKTSAGNRPLEEGTVRVLEAARRLPHCSAASPSRQSPAGRRAAPFRLATGRALWHTLLFPPRRLQDACVLNA